MRNKESENILKRRVRSNEHNYASFDKGDKIAINYKTVPNSGLLGNSEHIYITLTPQITGLLNSDPETLYEGES